MKRVGNLWGDLCSKQNAIQAIYEGTEHKRQDRQVKRTLGYADDDPQHQGKLDPEKVSVYAERQVEKLANGWTPSPMRHMTIRPPFGKSREIDCPTLSDHIIHWMLIRTIKPIIMRGMYKHSCGSIPDRGIDRARSAVERWVQHDDRAKYFVKLDVRKFYPNIDQDRLVDLFKLVIKDPLVIELIDKVAHALPKGLPIGAYTSQWFANFYLQQLDHHIVQDLFKSRRGKRINLVAHYCRYADDLLLIGSSKRDLEKSVRDIISFAAGHSCLEIKDCWEIKAIAKDVHDIGPHVAPIDFVGYRFYRDHTEIRGSIFLHTTRIAARIVKRLETQSVVLLHDAQSIVSLHGWFEHADSEYFFENYIYNRISIKFMQEVISYASKNGIVGDAARIFCGERGSDGKYHILYGCSGGQTRRVYRVDCGSVGDGLRLDG